MSSGECFKETADLLGVYSRRREAITEALRVLYWCVQGTRRLVYLEQGKLADNGGRRGHCTFQVQYLYFTSMEEVTLDPYHPGLPSPGSTAHAECIAYRGWGPWKVLNKQKEGMTSVK